MKVVTAYSEDYKEMFENLSKCKYEIIAHKLEDLEDNKKFIKQCHYKLDFIRDALENNNDDIAWIDADCIVKDLGNPLKNCDVAVTLRRKEKKDRYYNYSGLLNAGVIFFRKNTERFIDMWEKELPNGEFKTDQEALNKVVGANENTKVGDIIVKNDIRIKILSCDEYNFFYFPEKNNARVLHFKGDKRHYYNQYHKIA